MKHLTNLFKLMELTRSQPQYGYALAGIQQDELSNLAEHHFSDFYGLVRTQEQKLMYGKCLNFLSFTI